MATSAGFVPAAAPPCAYAPNMTLAAAIALRDAASLDPNCVVIVPGPTIGVPGFTSPTSIEIQPAAVDDLGQAVLVHTSFDNSAWAGLFDADTNSLYSLTDNRNNHVFDTDLNSATVETQWPWGQGTATQLRDNEIQDSTFTWALPFTAGFTFTDNEAVNTTFDFTGLTTNFFGINNSEFRTTKLVASATGTGVTSISRLKMTGVLATTVLLSLANTGATGVTIRGAEINEVPVSISHSLGTVGITDSAIKGVGSTVTLAAAMTINDSQLQTANVNIQTGTTGNNSINRSRVTGGTITKTTGSTGALFIDMSNLGAATITLGAANAGTTNTFQNVDVQNAVFNLQGPLAGANSRNDFTVGARFAGGSVTVAATATAGIGVQGGTLEGSTVTQNRNAGTGEDVLFNCSLRGFATFTINTATDPGVGMSFNRITAVDSTITVGNVTGQTLSGTILQQADLIGSTLTLVGPNGPSSATSFLNRLRMHGASLSNAGFGCDTVIIDGGFTKTFGSYQTNRLCNMSFDNVT